MHRGRLAPLMNATALISAAWPRNSAKEIERRIGCSPRQARRMVTTGKVPGHFRRALIELLDRQITTNRLALERLERELKAIEHVEMVTRIEDRRAPSLGKFSKADS